jgi:hypothetical protein
MTVNYFLILVILLLFAGLGVDAGMLEWRYLQMSTAARAAAISGVIGLQRYGSSGAPYNARQTASLNGFTDGSNGVTVTFQNPPTAGPYANNSYCARAIISQSVATSFMSLVSFPKVTMQALYDQPGSTPVSLTSSANVYGIFTNGTTVTNGGFDTKGYAFSANALDSVRTSNNLGALLSWRGNIFSLGLPNVADAVANATIPLTSGKFSQLLMLASTAFGPYTSTFVVKYSDSSTASTTLSMSDWYAPSYYANEVWVQSCTYRLNGSTYSYGSQFNVYGYAINLNNSKTVSSLTLPNNRDVVVLAINLMP